MEKEIGVRCIPVPKTEKKKSCRPNPRRMPGADAICAFVRVSLPISHAYGDVVKNSVILLIPSWFASKINTPMPFADLDE